MSLQRALCVAVLTAMLEPAVSAEGLRINILNYAEVPPTALNLAIKTAGEVFRRAGVHTAWCIWQPKRQSNPCRRGALHMYLISDTMRHQLGLNGELLGMALLASDGHTGDGAYVFADTVNDLADNDSGLDLASFARLLGNVIVHESGHLLLGAGNHQPHSIMTSKWGIGELRWAQQGTLLFRNEQARSLRESVKKRTENPPPTVSQSAEAGAGS